MEYICVVNLFLSILCRNTLTTHWASLPINLLGRCSQRAYYDRNMLYGTQHQTHAGKGRETKQKQIFGKFFQSKHIKLTGGFSSHQFLVKEILLGIYSICSVYNYKHCLLLFSILKRLCKIKFIRIPLFLGHKSYGRTTVNISIEVAYLMDLKINYTYKRL